MASEQAIAVSVKPKRDPEDGDGGDDDDEEEGDGNEEHPPRPPTTRPQPLAASGFKSVVRKLQLAAKMSTVSQGNEELDEFREDVKVNRNAITRGSILKRSRYQKNRHKTSSLVSLVSLAKPSTSKAAVASTPPAYVYGDIRFSKHDPKQNVKPYLAIDPNQLHQENIDHILKSVWQLEMPKIVTLIVSGKSHHHQWANKKQIKNFQTGIAKAAMSTNMWILTNGLNGGVTSYICSAIEGELRRLKQKQLDHLENVPLVIGICHELELTYGHRLGNIEHSKNIVFVENVGYSDVEDKFELDPFHSHYVILKTDTVMTSTASTTKTAAAAAAAVGKEAAGAGTQLPPQQQQALAKAKLDFVIKLLRNESFVKDNEHRLQQHFNGRHSSSEATVQQVPLVSILIEGGADEALHVLNLIKTGIPVVVLKGSGGIADLLAFAYTRIWSSITDVDSWDADHIEDFIKPLLVQKVSVQLPSMKNRLLRRNVVCDQIIECVRLSKRDHREYINILDMYDRNAHQLTNLSELLLDTLLNSSRSPGKITQEQVLKDFDLIIDWNCASVAKNLVFSQHSRNITDLFKSKFFASLTRLNREEFVDIFLSHGFQVHKFLTPSQLARLYRHIHDDDFFHSVCWETALGHSGASKQSKFFIEKDLNWLIEFCTGLEVYVNSEELHTNAQGLGNSLSAERKALILLSFWAVMQNRYKLVEVIWKHGDHPVHHALVISMFFERFSWHVLDTNLKAELKNRSKQFANYANGVLDRCYDDNITLAYNVLKESIKDWNYMTAVDLAANAQLRQFLGHICCQKWLTNLYYGHIRLRKLAWGVFTIPNMLKILLCSIFILPMFIWIRFKDYDDQDQSPEIESGDNEDEEVDVYDKIFAEPSSDAKLPEYVMESSFINTTATTAARSSGEDNKAFEMAVEVPMPRQSRNLSKSAASSTSSPSASKMFVKKQLPLWRMIFMMWSSPITKFYTSQLFYYIYLIILSISTLYPDQGNFTIDSIVCVWTLLTTVSHIRHAYVIFLKYNSISLYYRICEIVLIGSFTVLLTLTRIFHLHLYPIYTQKIINSLALVYFYYRFILIYLPISSTLGPLLYRFRLMVSVDFVNYLRIVLVIIVSNAIVMNSLEFPWKEFNWDTCSKVLHDGILTLFYGPPREITVYTQNPHDFKNETNLDPTNQTSTMQQHSPLPIYIFLFQYFIILKLIIGALLFAIFSATASKWVHDVDNIWKFQRYLLVIDFANRLSLPEPLSLFYYLYWLGYYLVRAAVWCTRSKSKQQQQQQQAKRSDTVVSHNIIAPEDCLYWRELAAEYLETEQQRQEDAKILHRSWEYTQEIAEELEYEKRLLREIKGKLFELEKNITSKQESTSVSSDLSRTTPYPGTKIARFPVPRKYISWNVNYFAYEPVSYSRQIEEYPHEVQPFVDEDILGQREEALRRLSTTTTTGHSATVLRPSPFGRNSLTLLQIPGHRWNRVELESRGILIDRRLWSDRELAEERQHPKDDEDEEEEGEQFFSAREHIVQPTEYRLEDDFLPLNPHGRTGLRGRGALQRWAVNHYVFVVVAQVERGRIERVLCERSHEHGVPQLIERFVNNKEEMYQQVFTSLFPEPSQPSSVLRNWDNLRERLARIFGDTIWWWEVSMAHSGYLDDPMNTDNAWKEANVCLVRFGSMDAYGSGGGSSTSTSSEQAKNNNNAATRLRPNVPRCLRNTGQLLWCNLSEEFFDNLSQVHTNLLSLVGIVHSTSSS